MSGRRLLGQASMSTIGQVVLLVGQLGVLSAVARHGDLDQLGALGLALAVATPVFTFCSMGLRLGQATDVDEGYTFSQYSAFRAVTTVFGAVSVATLGLVVSDLRSSGVLVLAVIALKVGDAASELSYGMFLKHGQVGRMTRSQCWRGLLGWAAVEGSLSLGSTVCFAIGLQAVVVGTRAFGFDLPRARRLDASGEAERFDRSVFRSMLRLHLPLGAGSALGALGVAIPRLLVSEFLDLAAVGIFTALAYFQQAGTQLSNAVGQVLWSRLARYESTGNAEALRRTVRGAFTGLTLVSAAGLFAGFLLGEHLLTLLFGEAYSAEIELFRLVLLAAGLRIVAAVPASLLISRRRFDGFMILQALTLAFMVACLALLLPRFGLVGAGIGLVLSATFRLLVLMVLLSWPARRSSQNR